VDPQQINARDLGGVIIYEDVAEARGQESIRYRREAGRRLRMVHARIVKVASRMAYEGGGQRDIPLWSVDVCVV
jgi:hypothetical protein